MNSQAAGGVLSHKSEPASGRRKETPRPAAASAEGMAALQQSAGNAAVRRLFSQSEGAPMPPALRREMEQRFGQDFSQVRLHDGPRAADLAENLSAKAFTFGSHIAFSSGRFMPDTREGKRLLGHELAHVVQQSRGGPPPTGGRTGALEQDAASAAENVASGAGAAPAGASDVGVMCDDDPKPRQAPIDNSGPTQSAGLANNVDTGVLNTEINATAALQGAADPKEGPAVFAPGVQVNVRDKTGPNTEQGVLASYGGVAPFNHSALTTVPGSSYQTGSLAYTRHDGSAYDPNNNDPQNAFGNWLTAGFQFGNPGAGVNWNPAVTDTFAYSHSWGDNQVDLNAGATGQWLGSVNNRNVNAFLSPYVAANYARQFGPNQINVEGLAGANLGLGGAADRSNAAPDSADPSVPASMRLGGGIGFQHVSGDKTWGVEAVGNTEVAPNIRNASGRTPWGAGVNLTVSSF